ncbi:hypothetical protein F6W96_28130 [Nocardia terpenica]|uniref:Lanthionine synthetase n=1 Tax=Nocardia terpenica TaxID=455432 RepID=A0A6G9Z8B4_9NOCA|nr:hypothetical protein F6W96_28130 [Nocardia terpenica]
MREFAREVAMSVANRIASPRRITECGSTGADNGVPYSAGSLVNGHPGIVLLLARLGTTAPERLREAHDHLSAAVSALGSEAARPCLFYGPPALAFATHIAAADSGNYTSLLARLDDQVSRSTGDLLRATKPTSGDVGTADTRPIPAYDLIFGLSGLGRYLLLRPDRHAEMAGTVVRHLVEYTFDLLGEPDGRRGNEQPEELLVGTAHGMSGILAVLALAYQAGVVVPDHDAAIRRVADALISWQRQDDTTLCWPYSVQWNPEESAYVQSLPSTRPAWCNGATGVISALMHAGRALDVDQWTDRAIDAAVHLSRLEPRAWRLNTVGLCHGYAGLLQWFLRMKKLTGRSDFDTTIDAVVERILEFHDPAAPFAFRRQAVHRHVVPEGPGFIDGAAGTALALISYADGLPESEQAAWDSALLFA